MSQFKKKKKVNICCKFTRILMEPVIMEHLETDLEHGKDWLKESVLHSFAKWKRHFTEQKCKRRWVLEITETEQCVIFSPSVIFCIHDDMHNFLIFWSIPGITGKASCLLKSWIFSGLLDLKLVFLPEEYLTVLFWQICYLLWL